MIVIGLDPGKDTGVAVWDAATRQLQLVESMAIDVAMDSVLAHRPGLVIFEDARLRRYFADADKRQAKYGAAIREGVGSVKRDCAIWEGYLTRHGIPFIARGPQARTTKWTSVQFERVTRWPARTNNHARDAACLVFGLNIPNALSLLHTAHANAPPRPSARRATKQASPASSV